MPNSFLPKTKKQKRGNLSPDLNYWLVHSSKTLILAGLFIFASAFIDLPEKSFTGSLAFTCHVPVYQCAGPHPCPTSVDVDVEIETLKGGNHTYTHTYIYIYAMVYVGRKIAASQPTDWQRSKNGGHIGTSKHLARPHRWD